MQAEISYRDWEQIEKDWTEYCEPALTFLIEKIEITKEIVDPKARAVLAKLLTMLRDTHALDDALDID